MNSVSNTKQLVFKFYVLLTIGSFFLISENLYSQERDSLFSNSLFYNSIYDDGTFVDSTYIANLIEKIEISTGEEKIGLLFKLLNGYYFSNPELARKLSKKALNLSLKENNDSLIAFSYHYHALAHIYLDYPIISNKYYTKALATDYAKRKSDFHSWVLMNMGENYSTLEEYDISAKYYFNALKINEKIKNIAFAAKIYENLSQLFFITGNYSESIKNNNLALSILDREKDKRIIADLFIQRFNISFAKGNVDSAEIYYNRALKNGIELNDSLLLTQIFYEYGNELFDNGFYLESQRTFQKGMSYCNPNIFDVKYNSFLHGMGKSNLFLGNTLKAKEQLLEAQKGFKSKASKENLQKLELSLSQLYAKLGDWNKFNIHYTKSEEYRIAQLKVKELNTINELKIAYDTEKKDSEIKAKEKQIWLISGIAFAILIGLFTTLFLSRKLKFANKNLIDKNLELSERWNQLQKFYGSAESNSSKTTQNELFHRIYQLMVKEQVYTKADITVDYLSKKLSSNTKYISKAIKEETGMNFNTFINTFRIEEAKKLLRDKISSTWSLDAVAEQSGFNNTTSFFQAFKKNTGLTPSAFRNALATSIFE